MAGAQADFAIDPTDMAPNNVAPVINVEKMSPWLALKSIGFFQNRAELASWEAVKIAEIVSYVAGHPGVELGIHRPAPATNSDPSIAELNQRRVRTVIDGLITAGVSEDRILLGNDSNLPLSLDQQVDIFVRRAL